MPLVHTQRPVLAPTVLPAQHADEFFDVVDAHDRVLYQERRSVVHAQRLRHRAVHILLLDARGHLLLQRRSRFKDTNPGKWTTACCGHVDAGEAYLDAARRELREELGVCLDAASPLTEIWRHEPCRATGHEFIRVYTLRWNGPLQPDPDEVAELRWLCAGDLSEAIAERPRVFTASLRLIWQHCADRLV
ncbi:MAG: NUDIX domain-containing protein [Opitutales bacterium]